MSLLQSIRGGKDAQDVVQDVSKKASRQAQDVSKKASRQAKDMTSDNPQETFFGAMENVPTPVYYWLGIASIVSSAALFFAGKKQEAQFVGQWPPTFLLLALIYKQLRPSRES